MMHGRHVPASTYLHLCHNFCVRGLESRLLEKESGMTRRQLTGNLHPWEKRGPVGIPHVFLAALAQRDPWRRLYPNHFVRLANVPGVLCVSY